jgi:hypothetical protein
MSSFDLNHIYKYIKSKTGIVTKPTKIFYLSLLENNSYYCNDNDEDEDNNEYYDDNYTIFNKVAIGHTNILQTSTSPLFKEESLKNRIGTNSSTVTLLNYNKSVNSNHSYLEEINKYFTSSNESKNNRSRSCIDFQNLYNSSVSTIYRLNENPSNLSSPSNTIGISHAPLLENFGNFYGLPKNIYEIAPITFGTGEYLNKNGFVLIATGKTTTKMILLYLINSSSNNQCSIIDKEIDCNEIFNFNSIDFNSTINLWIPNQKTQIIKKKNSLKVILNQTTSTPGVLLPNIKVLSNKIKINFDIQVSEHFNVNPFIKDLDGNIYYWINNHNYLIESCDNYIILSLPNNLINNSINIYLLATSNCNKFNLYDSFTITNFSIYFS